MLSRKEKMERIVKAKLEILGDTEGNLRQVLMSGFDDLTDAEVNKEYREFFR